MKPHWSARGLDDYLFKIGFDFVAQIEKRLKTEKLTQDDFAKKLNVTKGRISQILNSPGNLTLSKIIEYATVLGMKVSIVAYDDKDPENAKGPINSDIFRICWEKAGKPEDFFAFTDAEQEMKITTGDGEGIYRFPFKEIAKSTTGEQIQPRNRLTAAKL